MGKYILSFTAASALLYENITIAKQQVIHKDWAKTRKVVLEENLLMKDKQATALRQYKEIELRMKTLSDSQVARIATGDMDEVKIMVWLSVLNTYEFFKDISLECVYESYFFGGKTITNSDYYAFWESKKIQYPEIEKISDATAAKIKQVAFKIMEQVGIIDSVKTRNITVPLMSVELENEIKEDSPEILKMFLR